MSFLSQKPMKLARKYKGKIREELYGDEDEISCEFLKNLDRGGLSVPTFSMVNFVYIGYLVYKKVNTRCNVYRKYFIKVVCCKFK